MTLRFQDVVKNGSPIEIVDAFESLCKCFGYGPIKSCYCEGHEKIEQKNKKENYATNIRCIHYGKSAWTPTAYDPDHNSVTEGIVMSMETFRHEKNKLKIIKEAFRHAQKHNEKGTSFTESLADFRKSGIVPTLESTVPTFHAYGGRWENHNETNESTNFICKKSRLPFLDVDWGKRLGLPTVVKRIKTRKFLKRNVNLN